MRTAFLAMLALLLCRCVSAETVADVPSAFEGAEVLTDADALTALAAKTKPLAVWNETDMLWVRRHANGSPQFLLNRAVRFDDAQRPRWALVRRKPDVNYVVGLDGQFSYCEVNVVPTALQSDGGAPPHALVVARTDAGDTLYRVRWSSEGSTGVAHPYTLRDVFVLRTPKGNWRLLGEGASLLYSGAGPSDWFGQDVSYRIDWPAEVGARDPIITATFSETWGAMYEEPSRPSKHDFTCLREGTLDLATHRMRWGGHAYTLASAGESLDCVVDRIGEWKLGYYYDYRPERRGALLDLLRPVIRTLNPRSAAKQRLPNGERILVPEDAEITRALKGSPATHPSHRK
jgi:hypothetical protein